MKIEPIEQSAGTRPRYRDKAMQNLYATLLALANDLTSELYVNGRPRRGAIHRSAFWDGYSGVARSGNATPGTLSGAAFEAGKTFARVQAARRAADPDDPANQRFDAGPVRMTGFL